FILAQRVAVHVIVDKYRQVELFFKDAFQSNLFPRRYIGYIINDTLFHVNHRGYSDSDSSHLNLCKRAYQSENLVNGGVEGILFFKEGLFLMDDFSIIFDTCLDLGST